MFTKNNHTNCFKNTINISLLGLVLLISLKTFRICQCPFFNADRLRAVQLSHGHVLHVCASHITMYISKFFLPTKHKNRIYCLVTL